MSLISIRLELTTLLKDCEEVSGQINILLSDRHELLRSPEILALRLLLGELSKQVEDTLTLIQRLNHIDQSREKSLSTHLQGCSSTLQFVLNAVRDLRNAEGFNRKLKLVVLKSATEELEKRKKELVTDRAELNKGTHDGGATAGFPYDEYRTGYDGGQKDPAGDVENLKSTYYERGYEAGQKTSEERHKLSLQAEYQRGFQAGRLKSEEEHKKHVRDEQRRREKEEKKKCEEADKKGYKRGFDKGFDKACQRILDLGVSVKKPAAPKDPTLLMKAIERGSVEDVNLLLKLGSEVDFLSPRQPRGPVSTPLHVAIELGRLEIVKILLPLSAKKEDRDPRASGKTPLILAAEGGHHEIVELLIAEVKPDRKDKVTGRTALMAAAANGHKRIVDILIGSQKVNVNTPGPGGKTALHEAIFEGRDEIVQSLIQNGARIDSQCDQKRTSLHYAVMGGQNSILDLLLRPKYKPRVDLVDSDGNTPLLYAIVKKNEEAIAMLLNAVPIKDYPDRGYSSLATAARLGNVHAVEKLLDSGASANRVLDSSSKPDILHPLQEAVKHKHPSVANVLLKRGCFNEEARSKALCSAIQQPSTTMVRVFIDRGPLPEKTKALTEKTKREAMCCAIEHGLKDMIELLCRYGFPVQVTDKGSRGPLQQAIKAKKSHLIRFLVWKGANVEYTNEKLNGFRPLHYAVQDLDYEAVETLLELKAQTWHRAYDNDHCRWCKNNNRPLGSTPRCILNQKIVYPPNISIELKNKWHPIKERISHDRPF